MRYDLECPRCNKRSSTISDKKPRVHCGDCLMSDVEIVVMLAKAKDYETERFERWRQADLDETEFGG